MVSSGFEALDRGLLNKDIPHGDGVFLCGLKSCSSLEDTRRIQQNAQILRPKLRRGAAESELAIVAG